MIKWDESLAIGVEAIDQEHQMIIEEFHHLYELMSAGKGHEYYDGLIGFLNKYVDEHFEHEEAFQQSIDYPKYEEHKAIHEEFKKKVADLLESHKGRDVSDIDLIKLNLMIKDWLVHHIVEVDMELGSYYKSMKENE